MKKYDFALLAMYIVAFALTFTFAFNTVVTTNRYKAMAEGIASVQDIDSLIIRNTDARITVVNMGDTLSGRRRQKRQNRWIADCRVNYSEANCLKIEGYSLVIDSLKSYGAEEWRDITFKIISDIGLKVENSPNVEVLNYAELSDTIKLDKYDF